MESSNGLACDMIKWIGLAVSISVSSALCAARSFKMVKPPTRSRLFANRARKRHLPPMPKRDESQEALRQVEKITGSRPVRGETLLRSRKLKKQLAEARKRLKKNALSAICLVRPFMPTAH
jgi:hypothetical protein